MGTKAYFMINVDRQIAQQGDSYRRAINELEEIPEVQFVEPVLGIYDLMVKVDVPIDVPITVALVANKILEKEWVRRLHVLKVEPVERNRAKPIEYDRISEPSVKGVAQT